MQRSAVRTLLSITLAFALVFTCINTVPQPLLALANDGSESVALENEHLEKAESLTSVEEVGKGESLDLFDKTEGLAPAVEAGKASDSLKEAGFDAVVRAEPQDVTKSTDQLELSIASFTWKNAADKYSEVEKAEDGSYRLPTPFEGIKGLHILLDFKILKNDETRTIHEGDFFTFALDQQKENSSPNYFVLADMTQPRLISFGGAAIGKYTIENNVLKVVFDKDVDFEVGYTGIKGGVGLDFQLNDQAFGVEDETGLDLVLQDVTDPVHVVVPPKSSLVDGVDKSGVYDPETRSITWTIKAGTQSPGIDMAGMQIVDTFEVSSLGFLSATLVASDGSETDVTSQVSVVGGACTYEFPVGSIAPQILKIKTLVKDDALPQGAEAIVGNDVKLEKGSSPYKPGPNSAVSATTKVPGMGLQKLGEQVGGNRMQWSIVINDASDAWLYDVVVTDTLTKNLVFVPDSLKIDDREVPVHTSNPAPTPTSDYATLLPGDSESRVLKIYFKDTEADVHGNKPLISKRHRITFETELSGSSVADEEIRNEASLSGTWPSGSGTGPSFNHSMGIGAEYKYAYLDKKGSVDEHTGVITWNVNPQTRMDDFTQARIVDKVDASDQKFIPESVTLSYDGANFTQQQLIEKGWLTIAGTGLADSPTSLSFVLPQADFPCLKEVRITYQTQATEGYLNGQHGQTHTYRNVADLEVATDRGVFKNTAKAEVPLANNLIDKTAAYEFNDTEGKGFLHYTLKVNANKMELNDVEVTDDFSVLKSAYYTSSGAKVADIPTGSWIIDTTRTKITDSLDRDLVEGADYKNTSSNNRFSVKLGASPDHKITDTYTIHLYQTLTPEARQKFLLESGSGYIRTENVATITGKSSGGDIERKAVHVTTPEGGDVKNELVDKSSILRKDQGLISWRIDINPQAASLDNASVKDVLNKSLQLDHASVKLYESKHGAGGNIEADMSKPVPWTEVAPRSAFTVEPGSDGSSVLNVDLPNEARAYTLVYDTAIVEAVNVGYVQNKASLINGGDEKGSGSHTQEVDNEAWGYLERTASYRFQKVDAFGGGAQPLGKGVVFGLYSDSACTSLLKTVTANNDGIFAFYGLISGTSYWYKELQAPDGYTLDSTIYELKVPAGTLGLQPMQTITNTRVVGAIPVSIEKKFAFNAGDTATDLKASFKLIMRPLGATNSKRVGITLDGSGGSYTYKESAASPEAATVIETAPLASSATDVAKFSIANLPWGSYELVETSTSTGYALFGSGKKFTVDRTGDVTFDSDDFQGGSSAGAGLLVNNKTHITLQKQLNGVEKAVPGVVFSLYDETGTSVVKSPFTGTEYTWSPNGLPWEIVGLPAGSYLLRETSPASDSTIAQMPDVSLSLDEKGVLSLKGTPANVSKTNNSITVNNVSCAVSIKKLDQLNAPVVGASLELQRKTPDGGWEKVRDLSDSDGSSKPADGIYEVGGLDRDTTYRILETITPAGYMEAKPIVFTVDTFGVIKDVDLSADGVDAAYANAYESAKRTFTLRDERLLGHAQFVKQVEGGTPLAGVTFDLYRQKSSGEASDVRVNEKDSFQSDARGRVSTRDAHMKNTDTGQQMSGGLVPGTYYFKETGAPASIAFDAENPLKTASFVVESDGSNRYTGSALQGGAWPAYSVITVGSGTVTNFNLAASVKVKKVSADGKPLAGAVFSLVGTDVAGKKIEQSATSDTAGLVLFDNVGAGAYTVQEVAAPAGYKISSQINSVKVLSSDVGRVYEINNGVALKNIPNEFRVSKISSDEKSIPLSGAEFKLEGIFADGLTLPLLWTSTDKPTSFFGKLIASTPEKERVYKLTEIKAPEGCEGLASPLEIKIDPQGNLYQREVGITSWSSVANNNVVVTNETKSGSMQLLKVDARTKTPLAGVTFALFDKTANKAQGTYVTDAQGKIKVEDLSWGRYVLQEVSAEGYGVSQKQHEFTIGLTPTGLRLRADLGTVENEPLSITFVKQELYAETCSDARLGAEGADATRPLGGAEFTLYRDRACTQIAKTISGENLVAESDQVSGLVEFTHMPAGAYWMKETFVPVGHVENDTLYSVAVDTAGVVTRLEPAESTLHEVLGEINNDVHRADIVIKKVAETNADKVLPGSTYGLYKRSVFPIKATDNTSSWMPQAFSGVELLSADSFVDTGLQLIAKAITDDKGVLTFEGVLMNESYVIKELVAPDGSLVSQKPIEITFAVDENGKTTISSFDDGSGTAWVDAEGNIVWREPQVMVSFAKVDPQGRLLSGAKLQVLDENGLQVVAPWVSTDQGGYVIEGVLVAGKAYQLVEIEAPEGYEKVEPLRFVVENPELGPDENFVQVVNLVNQPLAPEEKSNQPGWFALSKTGDSSPVILLGAFLVLSGITLVGALLRKRRRL